MTISEAVDTTDEGRLVKTPLNGCTLDEGAPETTGMVGLLVALAMNTASPTETGECKCVEGFVVKCAAGESWWKVEDRSVCEGAIADR